MVSALPMSRLLRAAAAAAVLFASCPAVADEQEQAATRHSALPLELQRLTAADALAEAGREGKDALLLIAAARMLRLSGVEPPAPGEGVPPGEQPGEYPVVSVTALLTEARALAAGSPLLPLIDDMLAEGEKGAADGMITRLGNLPGAGALTLRNIEFTAGALALVHVLGKGAGDVDVFIFNSGGTEICRDDDRSNSSFCAWTPPKKQSYTIRIVNKGSRAVPFRLTTN
jgi:hypothetical protein